MRSIRNLFERGLSWRMRRVMLSLLIQRWEQALLNWGANLLPTWFIVWRLKRQLDDLDRFMADWHDRRMALRREAFLAASGGNKEREQ